MSLLQLAGFPCFYGQNRLLFQWFLKNRRQNRPYTVNAVAIPVLPNQATGNEAKPTANETTPTEDPPTSDAPVATATVATGILWVNNIYPIKRSRIDIRGNFVGNYSAKIRSVFPNDARNIVLLQRVIKEGGVYVHFKALPNLTLAETVDHMTSWLSTHNRAMFPFAAALPKAFSVQGQPFVHDIDSHLPSSRLRVYFKGPELLKDDVYNACRLYGHISHVELPKGLTKDEPKYVVVQFRRIEAAISARNCLHRSFLNNTQLLIEYESFETLNFFKNLFVRHPRIMIPLIGILGTLGTVLLFDPLRIGSIIMKMRGGLKTIAPRTEELYETKVVMNDVVNRHRRNDLGKIADTFSHTPNSVIIIYGPHGSGTSTLVKKVVEDRSNTLYILCQQRLKKSSGTSEDDFIEILSRSVGFFPSFTYINTLFSFVESFIPTGGKLMSSPMQAQVMEVLSCLESACAFALRGTPAVSTFARSKRKSLKKSLTNHVNVLLQNESTESPQQTQETEPEITIQDEIGEATKKVSAALNNSSADQSHLIAEYAENLNTITKKIENGDVKKPVYPVIIFDDIFRYLRTLDNKDKANLLAEVIFKWAFSVTASGTAHVVFATGDPFANQVLRRYADNRGGRLETIVLDDFGKEAAREILTANYGSHYDVTALSPQDQEYVLSCLGGRLSDLLAFRNKYSQGMSAQSAIKQMVADAISIIRSEGFGQKVGSELVDRKAPDSPWSRTGLWETVKLLSKHTEIDYDELLFTTTTFAGDEKALNSLIHLNLLRIIEDKESNLKETRALKKVLAFSPLYRTAFKTMTTDPKLSTGMNILLVRSQIDRENGKIQAYEDELKKLGSLTHSYFGFESEPLAVQQRRKFLEERMNESNAKVAKYEEEHQRLLKVQAELYRK